MTKEKEFDVEGASRQLLRLFEAHSRTYVGWGDKLGEYPTVVSEEGLLKMSTFFSTVPEEERGYVFLSFLADLYEEGYKYDAQQFLNMEEANDG